MAVLKDNVIRLYDVRPEMALEHLKRSTGLDFDNMPQSLASIVEPVDIRNSVYDNAPPVLTDIVELSV